MTRHRGLRAVGIALLALLVLVIVIRLVLDPLASRHAHKALAELDGYTGDFERLHISVLPPAVDITHFKLTEDPAVPERQPLLYADRVHLGIAWRRLLHGELVTSQRIVRPKITIVNRKPTIKEGAEAAKKKAPPPDLTRQLAKIVPLKVSRMEVLDGELVFRDASEPRRPEVWVHKLDLVAQNLPTRIEKAGGRPSTVTAHGKLGRSGDLTLFVTADAFARPLSFAGEMALRGFKAAELYDFIEPKAHVQTPSGTIDLFAQFVSKDGKLTGGVKPVLKNIEVRPTDDGLWDRLKAWLGDKSVELASDRVPGRNAIATTIPIKGTLGEPDIQLWPAVLGVIRNAFVQGLRSGFSNLPPPTAGDKESPLTQAKHALEKDQGPPKAQPTQGDKK